MKPHQVYDQWGPAQQIPTIIFGSVGVLLFIGYLMGYLTDAKWGIAGCFFASVSASTMRCGHLALRANELDSRVAQLEESLRQSRVAN